MFRCINIVDRLDRVNFGIWNAAIATAAELRLQFGTGSEIWYPRSTGEAQEGELNGALSRPLDRLDKTGLPEACQAAGLDPARDIIVTHGCWQYPTRWGRALKRRGFAWMAVPHGMLEPWSLSQKRLQKWIYFRLVEKRSLLQADRIRAVGRPEFENLQPVFGARLLWIANGVPTTEPAPVLKAPDRRDFLFMARLHHKKGVLPMLEGWAASSLAGRKDCSLLIAGPDDGELATMESFLNNHPQVTNIHYLGPVYGEAKRALLEKSHFYLLPSHSEGFPTSVLEAMQHGLVPLISDGCNFPEVFEKDLGYRVSPVAPSVTAALETACALSQGERDALASRGQALVRERYSHAVLAGKLQQAFLSLVPADHDEP